MIANFIATLYLKRNCLFDEAVLGTKRHTEDPRYSDSVCSLTLSAWSGGAMILGKVLTPGRPINLDESRARACCACSRCEWVLFGHFYSPLSFHFSFSLSMGDGPI